MRRSDTGPAATPLAARWAIAAGLRPSLLIGSRLAVDAGRGRRAIPVRSALVGAIVGVIGVVGCLTFRNGLSDAATEPMRSGVVWDYAIGTIGAFSPDMLDKIASDDAVAAARKRSGRGPSTSTARRRRHSVLRTRSPGSTS